ncbi:MAG: oligosaccharide flippase family protein [Rudaea sp.]
MSDRHVEEKQTLRERVLHGGAYLAVRQGMGVGLAFVGMLLLTRIIGPVGYGLYFTAFGIAIFLSQVSRFGVDVFLVRRKQAPDDAVYHQAFSFLLLSSTGLALLGLALSPLMGRWLGDSRVLAPLWALLGILPLTVLSAPPIARLERVLDYRKVAGVELVEQITYYSIALVLAVAGFGVWALVAGYALSQVWLVLASHVVARYRPAWRWSAPLVKEMLTYGSTYSASGWIWQLRPLATSLIVGRYLGPEGVAFVALSSRIIEGLSFIKTATYRLSIAALAQVQHDYPRLRAALEEAMALQILALGPLLAGFALVAPWLIPLLYGEQWRPALLVYPFIALGVLVNSVFNMHSSVLYVLEDNMQVSLFVAVHVTLLAIGGFIFVPRFGLVGWGLAELAALLSYFVIHFQVKRRFSFSYLRALPWLVVFAPPLFVPLVGFPFGLVLWLSLLAIPFSWAARAQIQEYWTFVRRRSTWPVSH